jgi:Fur family ferric uptake transcriptional regulator
VYHLADEPPHQHLVCVDCGQTLALSEAQIDEFVAAVRATTGFVLDPTHVALSGRCAACVAAAVRS